MLVIKWLEYINDEAAKVEELMLHLRYREFQAFSRVGLNVNDVTFSFSSERQSY